MKRNRTEVAKPLERQYSTVNEISIDDSARTEGNRIEPCSQGILLGTDGSVKVTTIVLANESTNNGEPEVSDKIKSTREGPSLVDEVYDEKKESV